MSKKALDIAQEEGSRERPNREAVQECLGYKTQFIGDKDEQEKYI